MEKTLSLILFSACQGHWGVCAEQIEEILDVQPYHNQKSGGLLFSIPYRKKEIQGIDFSCWMKGQDSPRKAVEKEGDIRLSPKNLIVKCAKNEYIGVQIDRLEELILVPIEHIHALPCLMQLTRRIHALWGIAVVGHRIILLIDLTQFARELSGEHLRVY